MDIRTLTEADTEAFWAHRLEGLELEPAAFGQSARAHRALSMEEFRGRMSNPHPGKFILGAFVDYKLVGTVGFLRQTGDKETHKGFIWGVYVQALQRGSGVGRALMAEALKRAKSLPGLEQITLAVGSGQTAAKNLYLSLGFEVWGREVRALKMDDVYVDEDHMVYWIK